MMAVRARRHIQDLGLRTTYLATGPSDPGIDLAVPFAVNR